jgi:hypothetical protein
MTVSLFLFAGRSPPRPALPVPRLDVNRPRLRPAAAGEDERGAAERKSG